MNQQDLPPNYHEPTTSVTNVSGGVNVDAEQVNIGGDVAGRDIIKSITQTINNFFTSVPEEVRDRRNKLILLDRVKKFWIEGVLDQTIYNAAMIELGKEVRSWAVERPWDVILETPNKEARTLPQGQSILEIFEQMDHALLILGEPGSGKTTTLLELARETISLAEKESAYPVPVIFNLSSWAERRQPLKDWLVEELNAKYQIPRKIGRVWIEQDALSLLLDGLDEISAEWRKEGVEAINRFREEHGLAYIVVCSRIADYEPLAAKLKLRNAIFIKPLSPDQVQQYLLSAGSRLAALSEEMQHDTELQTLAQSPLMLSVMSLVYQDASTNLFDSGSIWTPEAQRKHLFSIYVRRMSERRGINALCRRKLTHRWISWLAFEMNQRDQPLFLIEQLQPTWLSSRSQRWVYVLMSRLVGTLCLMVAIRLGYGTTYTNWWGVWLICWLIVSLIDIARFEDRTIRRRYDHSKSSSRFTFKMPVFGLSIGLGVFLIEMVNGPESHAKLFGTSITEHPLDSWINVLISSLTSGVLYGVVFEFIFGRNNTRRGGLNDIQTGANLKWSWAGARTGIVRGLAIWVLLVVIQISLRSVQYLALDPKFWLLNESSRLLLVSVLFILIGFGLGGLREKAVTEKIVPNQGIRWSARNAAVAATLTASLALLWLMLNSAYSYIQAEGKVSFIGGFGAVLFNWLTAALAIGFGIGLRYGFVDVLRHYTLRLMLWRQGHMPWNYARFLDDCVDRIFLRRVGGGYIFIHRYLMEYFASLEPEK